ncbi:MAG: hypothetical protein N3A69_00505 [Leptospiraceae bacterium]|nr:hypothetical protein [Leptospiraceae bacterium]
MRFLITFLIFLNLSCFIQDPNRKKAQKREEQNVLLLLLVTLNNICDPNRGGFYFPDFETGEYYCLRTSLMYEDSKVRVLVQNDLPKTQDEFGISRLDYSSIGKTFSETIYPKLTSAIGESSDVNQDGKIDIVFFGFSKYYSSGAFIAGFVDPLHLFQPRGLPSNQREILFINGLELQELRNLQKKEDKPDPLYSTIAHEFQHLIRLRYEFKMSNPYAPIPIPTSLSELATLLDFDETWIDEGTSEVASDIAGFGPQHSRIGCFRGDPRYGCRGGFSGRSLFDWSGSLMNYSFSYAFMKYLYEVSAPTTNGKNLFLSQTVTGTFPSRGKDTTSLMNTFINKASSYNSNLLTTNSTEVFMRLYALFLGLSLGYETNSTNSEDSYIQIGNSAPIFFNTISSSYPYPSDLQNLMNFSNDITQVSGSNFELTSSRVYRVKGTRASGPYSTFAVAVVRGKNGGSDPKDFLIFNGNPTKEGFISTKNLNEETISFSTKPILYLPITPQKVEIHIDHYFKQNTKYLLGQKLLK